MENYVLFSPIGTTDPIANHCDGPMLHIIRHYKPKKVYVFLTKTMSDLQYLDERYSLSIRSIDSEIEIEIIEREDIVKPNDFVVFDKIYEEILHKIKNENEGFKILANISSGTPQMLSSLYLLAAKIDIQLVAVETPKKEANNMRIEYNIQEEIRNNGDNNFGKETKKEVENRCKEIKIDNIVKMFTEKMIKQYIDVYDYNAALLAYKTGASFFDKKLEHAIQGASYRVKLEYSEAKKEFQKANISWNEITSVQRSDVAPLFEFILYLQTRQKSGNLMDFTRAVSPCLTNLFTLILEKTLKVNIADYCIKDKKNVLCLSRNKLMKNEKYILNLDSSFGKQFIDLKALAAANMLPIIEVECISQNKTDLYNKCKTLREFEDKIRNPIAHKISSVSEDYVKTNTDNNTNQILKIIKELFKEIVRHDVDWEVYKTMNLEILKLL